MKKLLFLFGLAACGGAEGGDAIEKIEGTASVGGKPAKITSCKAIGQADGEVRYVAVELGLDTGHTVIVDSYAGSKVRKGGETTKLDCVKTSSSMQSGNAGSKVWATGTVDFDCPLPDGQLVIAATIDCGSASRPSNRVERDEK